MKLRQLFVLGLLVVVGCSGPTSTSSPSPVAISSPSQPPAAPTLSPSPSPTPYADAESKRLEDVLAEAEQRYTYARHQRKATDTGPVTSLERPDGSLDREKLASWEREGQARDEWLHAMLALNEANYQLGLYLVEKNRDLARGVQYLQVAQQDFPHLKATKKLRELGVEPRKGRPRGPRP